MLSDILGQQGESLPITAKAPLIVAVIFSFFFLLFEEILFVSLHNSLVLGVKF